MEELGSLIERSCAGDLNAFGGIVRRFQDMAYGCAYAVLGDFHLAEDVAQETFVEAYCSLGDLRDAEAFPAWLRRIVLKYCDRISRRKRVCTVPLEAVAEPMAFDDRPDDVAERREMQERVIAAICSLPDGQRMATALFYIDGYSQAEIAAFLDVPVTTVKKRLHDARKRLKERMIGMMDETLKSRALPDDFADVVVRMVASEDDLAHAGRFLDYSSRHKRADFASVANAANAGIYVVGKKGEVEGAGYFGETEITIGSTVMKGIRPYEMGAEAIGVPDPAFVKSFHACFKLARERGIFLAAVHGSQYDHAFCGFVPCFYYPVATLSCEHALSIETCATIMEASDEEKEAASRAWQSDPYGPKMSAFIGGGVPHVIQQDGKAVGYIAVNRDFRPRKSYGMSFGYVPDISVTTRDAALAVIRLAGEIAAGNNDREICFMQSHTTLVTQAVLSLGGRYLLRPPCDLVGLDAEMVAIVELVGLMRELHEEFRTRLNASPAHGAMGAFSIEVAGATVGFVIDLGRVEVVAERQRVHRPLPRWLVTRLVMGYYSGDDVLAMGPIPDDRSDGMVPDNPDRDMALLVLPEPEAALFRALFPKLWPTSTPDPDVWPWIIGGEHPRYQNEQGKTPEMKAWIDALRFPWIGR